MGLAEEPAIRRDDLSEGHSLILRGRRPLQDDIELVGP